MWMGSHQSHDWVPQNSSAKLWNLMDHKKLNGILFLNLVIIYLPTVCETAHEEWLCKPFGFYIWLETFYAEILRDAYFTSWYPSPCERWGFPDFEGLWIFWILGIKTHFSKSIPSFLIYILLLAVLLRARSCGITIGDADAQVSSMGDSQLHSEPRLETTGNMLVFIYSQIITKFCLIWGLKKCYCFKFVMQHILIRLSLPIISTGHFDAIPGELRLKAYATRVLVAFMAVCLRDLVHRTPASEQTVDLKLATLGCTQIANWSLMLETYPLNLSEAQATNLYDLGMKHLVLKLFSCCSCCVCCNTKDKKKP